MNDDWEEQLAAFYHTDVELPATLHVDGKTLSNVGIQFRGNSSFFTVSNGRKRSMSVTLDHVNKEQDLEGYRALTLLNAHADPTYIRSVLYLDLATNYLPTPKANYVRVVINGESWGIYVNQQRFNQDFLKDSFQTTKGTRFKSSNRSRQGAFSYLGEDPDEYRKWYEIKDKDRDKSWKPLINLSKTLWRPEAGTMLRSLSQIISLLQPSRLPGIVDPVAALSPFCLAWLDSANVSGQYRPEEQACERLATECIHWRFLKLRNSSSLSPCNSKTRSFIWKNIERIVGGEG